MTRSALAWACALIGCAGPELQAPGPTLPAPAEPSPEDAGVSFAPPAPPPPDAPAIEVSEPEAAAPLPGEPERWLRGSTHVHARPSGDSMTPIATVIRWYESRGYDFIVLTDHNKVTEVDAAAPTPGLPATRVPERGLIVFAGIELTHNPVGCLPAGDDSGKCRIHVNLLGVTGRPEGKVKWAAYSARERVAKYQAALVQQQTLGGVAQINHPSWFWGMTGDVLAELARRGFPLVEIANVQFAKWNAGDATHPSLEALWDDALGRGVTLWGVATDDAHDYSERPGVEYPAGGAWVTVKARREPQAILDALATGRFYASTGVVLERAERDGDELVVEVAAGERGRYTIEMIENGKRVERVVGRSARRAVPATGYLRAVVTRGDGKRAWVQPARR